MAKPFVDMETGDISFSLSNDMLMDSDGHLMQKMSDNMALDLDSGEIRFFSSFGTNENDD